MIIPVTGSGTLPRRSSVHAAGADLVAAAEITLAPGERAAVPTGLHLAIPEGYVGLVWPRSGLALRQGIDTMAGVIDSDYRGEVKVVLINHGESAFTIKSGDRIAQLLVQPVLPVEYVRVEALPASDRGENGFGSTGI